MRPLISCTLLFVSVVAIFIPKRAAKACGFYITPGEYRFWLLQPDLTNQYDLTPFFFASSYLYRNDMQLARETYPDQNTEEWFKEIKGKATKKDIDVLLNDTDPQFYFDGQQQIAKRNSFMRLLMQPAQEELYRYILLSKKMELIAANPDPWEELVIPKGTFENMRAEARALRQEAKSEFVKLRTAFQLERLYAFSNRVDTAQQIYSKWIEPVKGKSWIKSAALYQIAVNTWGLKRHYLMSKVFDRGDYNRTPCLVHFNSEKLDSILPFAKNQHERNVMYAMKAFNYPGRALHYLQRIYRTEPSYKDLQFLLLREINKVEDWLLTTRLTDFTEPAVYTTYDLRDAYADNAATNYANDKAYAHQLYRFLVQVINDKKNQPTALLHLYAAHLCLVQKDYSCSQKHLDLSEKGKLKDAKAKMQLCINRLLLHLKNGFGAREESEFMAIINTPDKATGFYDAGIMKNQLVLYTARKLIRNENKAKGLMLLSRTNRALGQIPVGYKGVYQEIEEQAAPSDYNAMLLILDKKSKSQFEKFITKGNFRSPLEHSEWYEGEEAISWNRNKLLDGKASWYIRNHRLEESLAALKQIPDSFWKQEPYNDYIGGNPFYLNVYNSNTFKREKQQSHNKKQVIEQMVYLEQLAKKDKNKAAECYYQLANAWYNMSYYGKNWLMVRQWWSSFELSGHRGAEKKGGPFNDDYFGCRQAIKYYLQAIVATKDKQLASLCYFMVKECEKRNKAYLQALAGKYDDWPYYHQKTTINYKDVRKKGVDANYVKQLVNECELYQSFIKQYNRKL